MGSGDDRTTGIPAGSRSGGDKRCLGLRLAEQGAQAVAQGLAALGEGRRPHTIEGGAVGAALDAGSFTSDELDAARLAMADGSLDYLFE